MNILEAAADPVLFGPWCAKASWRPWRVFLATVFGLSGVDENRELFEHCTGRTKLPDAGFTEAWLICGRRSGKSFVLALIAVYLACFRDWRVQLGPGERGTVMVLAADRRQARVIMRYVDGLLEAVPMLGAMVAGRASEHIDLVNRVTIEVHTASFRAVRGYTVIAALLDEIAFWRNDESANPDREVLEAIRPAMATVPGAMLLCASSPYARRGVLFDACQRYFGKDDAPALVWRAPTRMMNPTVPQRLIDEAIERDPARAAAEWLAEFRSDVESFVSREVLERLVEPGLLERQPSARWEYHAFVDPSGGSADSMTLAIAHAEGSVTMLDCLRERRPPFSPEAVVTEFAQLLRRYRISTVTGDRYAGEWPREQFRKLGVQYIPADKTKSELYLELLAATNSSQVLLLDEPRLIGQLAALERRASRAGRDSIDHPPGAHDDMANAVAGALYLAAPGRVANNFFVTLLDDPWPTCSGHAEGRLDPLPASFR